MIAVIQRVNEASVTIENNIYSKIQKGLLILIGIETSDDRIDIEWLAKKIVNMRIFPDEQGIMNKSLQDCGGELLIVSQFTLHASTKKGNRPSYTKAATAQVAIPIYESFIKTLQNIANTKVQSGIFGADMKISLVNEGPVTIIVDSKNKQ